MDPTGEEHVMAATHGTCKPATVLEALRANGLANPRRVDFTQTEHVLLSLAKVVEQRDKHTAGHCERIAITSVALGMAMNLDRSNLLALYLGGFLHDVGKVGIPDSILFKP
ncbi:MAG TPA: HD domain-containing phosphohydrolase, partial [Candidatus Solibacter sp.]